MAPPACRWNRICFKHIQTRSEIVRDCHKLFLTPQFVNPRLPLALVLLSSRPLRSTRRHPVWPGLWTACFEGGLNPPLVTKPLPRCRTYAPLSTPGDPIHPLQTVIRTALTQKCDVELETMAARAVIPVRTSLRPTLSSRLHRYSDTRSSVCA